MFLQSLPCTLNGRTTFTEWMWSWGCLWTLPSVPRRRIRSWSCCRGRRMAFKSIVSSKNLGSAVMSVLLSRNTGILTPCCKRSTHSGVENRWDPRAIKNPSINRRHQKIVWIKNYSVMCVWITEKTLVIRKIPWVVRIWNECHLGGWIF